MSWPLVQIGKYADKVRTWNPAAGAECVFQYVDLSSVDKSRKIIDLDSVAKISSAEAPSRARQLIVAGDVLVATVRPNLNGIAVVPAELNGATASTGYCVLRADEKNLHGRYLFHWVQTGSFVEDMMSKATGANYPAVSDKIVKESKIPLPPLPEQKRIAAILDKADAIRRKRQQAIQLADDFLRAVFLDMFGDPVTNPKGWPVKSVKNLSTKIGSGSTPRGGSEAYLEEGISLIRSLNIHDDDFRMKNLAFIDDEQAEKLSNVEVRNGDVLLNITGASVCRCAMVPTAVLPARVNQHVCIIRPSDLINSSYLLHLLISAPYKQKLFKMSGAGATREALTKQQVESLEVPVPPKDLQAKFEGIQVKVRGLASSAESFKKESIFESLSDKAFSGQL